MTSMQVSEVEEMGLLAAVIPEELKKTLEDTTNTLNQIKTLLEELVEIERTRDARLRKLDKAAGLLTKPGTERTES